ncbi:hypothetical protein ACQ4PT_036205 [Festuca glaucescens]
MTGSAVVADRDDEEEDRIGALPDDVLRRVLSFLPSHQSVCTCVLARRWRDLWRSVPAVRVYPGETAGFVSSLILLRDRAPLTEFEIRSSVRNQEPTDAELWLRYAASCHVRVLRCAFRSSLLLPNMTLVCRQLTRLHVSGTILGDRTLEFSSCPVLDVLEMHYCQINANKISCQSLTVLSLETCFFPLSVRTHVSCPSLRALKLVDNLGLTLFLHSMPSLVTAYVRLFEEDTEDGYDHCYNGACYEESCLACYYIHTEGDECVLLHALSGISRL